MTDRIIVHNEKCRCGKNTLWLEIEGRTDDTLEFENGVKIAPMSLYKILEEIKCIRRFQLIQTGSKRLELRLVSDQKELGFAEAKEKLLAFFKSKGVEDLEIDLSDQLPQTNPVSGKFKHICKAESVK